MSCCQRDCYLVVYSRRIVSKPCFLQFTLAMSKTWIYEHSPSIRIKVERIQSFKHAEPKTWAECIGLRKVRSILHTLKNVKLMAEKLKEEPCNVLIWAGVHADLFTLQWLQYPRGSAEGGANIWWNCWNFKSINFIVQQLWV